MVLPEFERRGHHMQFVYLHDRPEDRAAIRTGPSTQLVNLEDCGEAAALASVRSFDPDVINVHGDIHPSLQARLLDIAPAAYSVHNYYGTCISGLKTHRLPVIQPCSRTFGPACLLQYFPRRCGGLNPVTMLQRYALESARLNVLKQYDAVITHSAHMEQEYTRHGIHPARIYGLPYEVAGHLSPASSAVRGDIRQRADLLFVGRMEKLKGGAHLIDALPLVDRALRRPLTLHFAGDGSSRPALEKSAARVMRTHPNIRIAFHGWLTRAQLEERFLQAHLLVLPSLWPETFGKVGPEAGAFGVPVAAYQVGGIPEWLLPGVNGIFAPGDPPTVAGLAAAIGSCIADPAVHARLSQGALANFNRFELRVHVDHLLELFERIANRRASRAASACAR